MIQKEKLILLRKEKRLTQMQVAEEIKVSRQAVSGWETGTIVPSIENDLCHPSSQGMTVQCPDFPTAPDSFYVMLTKVYQYCNTCGYKGDETFSESKYYIGCSFTSTSYVATNYKTRNRLGGPHEWKDTWSLYYSDPHA